MNADHVHSPSQHCQHYAHMFSPILSVKKTLRLLAADRFLALQHAPNPSAGLKVLIRLAGWKDLNTQRNQHCASIPRGCVAPRSINALECYEDARSSQPMHYSLQIFGYKKTAAILPAGLTHHCTSS